MNIVNNEVFPPQKGAKQWDDINVHAKMFSCIFILSNKAKPNR